MPRLPREDRERNEAIIASHKAETDANPLNDAEKATWRSRLSQLDGAAGNFERLAICRDLLRYAKEDHMLDSDERIIIEAVRDLELELVNETMPPRRRVRRAQPFIEQLRDDDDTSADSSEGAADASLADDDA